MISNLNVTIFSDHNYIGLSIIFPVNDFKSRMIRFSFPLRLFTFIVGNGALLCPDHDSIIYPTHCIDHSHNFAIIKGDINLFKPPHRHVIKRHNKFLSIIGVCALYFKYIVGQMVYVLLFSSMSKTSDVAPAYYVNVVLRLVHFLCVLELFHEHLVVIA